MPYIETTDGVPIYYLDEGPRSSSALFLTHASPLNSRFWQKNIPELSRHFRVVAMDTRGWGESGKTEDAISVAQCARDIRQICAEINLDKVVAVGWSFGATLLWNYMEQFGQGQLVGFVDVDKPPHSRVPEKEKQRVLTDLRARPLAFIRETLLKFLGPEFQISEQDLRSMVCECMKTPSSSMIAIAEEVYELDYTPFLPKVPVPSLILWAKYGSIQPDVAVLMSETMPDSQLVFFEHSGHLLPWTEPEKFNAQLITFARRRLG